MLVRDATIHDAKKISKIGTENKLTDYKNQKKQGFLVSDFDEKFYYDRIQEGYYFKVIEVNEDIKGFMFGYPNTSLNLNKRVEKYYSEIGETVFILKQVAITTHAQRMGLGKKLYQELLKDIHMDIYLAVCSEPKNIGSEKFHLKLGFEEVTQIKEIDELTRTIYRRVANGKTTE
jgi:L-amino acid N-acyltransferase YncA